MKRFQNILFTIQGSTISDEALTQAASVVQSTGANLSFLVVHADLSDEFQNIEDTFEKSLEEEIRAKLAEHGLNKDAPVFFETATPHFVTIIQYVLKKEYDLVIKAAESLEDKKGRGFKSLDMSLLRKCPCPVWLCREFTHPEKPRILTAIDPFSEVPEGYDLSIKLLEIGASLAENLQGENQIISCWDFEHEAFLKGSPFANMESSKVDAMVEQARQKHKQAMDQLLSEAGISGKTPLCERGKAYDVIPDRVETGQIDIVVMGTVARTGIPGFIIGNTAENILQKLGCGMFAVKPGGFVSPVKAY